MSTLLLMERTRDSVSFGRRLKDARQRRGLSQKELAGMIELHPRQVSKAAEINKGSSLRPASI